MSTLDPNDFDVKFGRHSNIPDCCIEFFIGEWQDIWPDRWMNKQYLDDYPAVGYVPCPACRQTKTFVTVHKCTEKCRAFLDLLRLTQLANWNPEYEVSDIVADTKEMFL